MIILGIESTHDDTSIAIVEDFFVVKHFKISQADIHSIYGGTIPEIASREHQQNFFILLNKLLNEYDLNKIDYIAYSEKPGLIGSLHIGFLFAHALSVALNKELIPIDHLEGHVISSLLIIEENKVKLTSSINYNEFPFLALVVSGGHSNIYLVENKNDFKLIGKTIDDAIGEVYDKIGTFLNIGFPGGPLIDQIYFENIKNYDPKEFIHFTMPKTSGEFDYSFSGLKTQVINYAKKNSQNLDFNLICISFQENIINYCLNIFEKAILKYKPKAIFLSGGVSANLLLREKFLNLAKKNNIFSFIPLLEYTTDNGAMIAARAFWEKTKN